MMWMKLSLPVLRKPGSCWSWNLQDQKMQSSTTTSQSLDQVPLGAIHKWRHANLNSTPSATFIQNSVFLISPTTYLKKCPPTHPHPRPSSEEFKNEIFWVSIFNWSQINLKAFCLSKLDASQFPGITGPITIVQYCTGIYYSKVRLISKIELDYLTLVSSFLTKWYTKLNKGVSNIPDRSLRTLS